MRKVLVIGIGAGAVDQGALEDRDGAGRHLQRKGLLHRRNRPPGLARLDEGEPHADLAMACLLAYPGSHFLSCVYPESTALFLAVFALYCARAGLAAPASLACRPLRRR